MANKIVHASISENGNAGWDGKAVAGDQTGREVYVTDWYNTPSNPWHTVLRPISPDLAEKSADALIWLANSNLVGYDQSQRNTAHSRLKVLGYDYKKLVTKCETDCSAFVTLGAIIGGCKELEYSDNAPTTSTMIKQFTETGKYQKLTTQKYLTSAKYLKKGDILVKNGHTVMVITNGANVTPDTVYYKKYTGTSVSIVDALKAVGETDTGKSHRGRIALANGIVKSTSEYSGSTKQNKALLALLKEGKLIKVS